MLNIKDNDVDDRPRTCFSCTLYEPVRDERWDWIDNVNIKTGEITKSWCGRCYVLNQYVEYVETKYLTTKLITEAYMTTEMHNGRWPNISFRGYKKLTAYEARPLWEANNQLQQLAEKIEQEIWFGKGLQDHVVNSSTRGWRIDFNDNCTFLVYSCAGRCRLSLQNKKDDNEHFTFQCDETSKVHTMGWIGILMKKEDNKLGII